MNLTTTSTPHGARRGDDPANDPMQQWREKIVEMIGKDIGALMPQELLQEIVKQAVQGELDRHVAKPGGYGQEPWIQQKVRDSVGNMVRQAVREEIKSREAEVREAVIDAVKQAIPGGMAAVIMSIITGAGSVIHSDIINEVQRARNGGY